jgi:hypothetical protein
MTVAQKLKGLICIFPSYNNREKQAATGEYMSRVRVALVAIGDAMLIAALVSILEIDQMINGTLYYYGLEFSYDWAQTYWILFRIVAVLLILAIIIISLVELPYPAFEETTEE